MRIIEHTRDILILYNPARNSWFGNIFMLFVCPPCFVLLLLISVNIWWKSLGLFIIVNIFFAVVKNIWSSNVIKFCSFNKYCGKITIEYHGLHTNIKDFPIQDARVKMIHNIGFTYGTKVENFELLLVNSDSFAGSIALSEAYYEASKAEIMLDRIQEFLLSNSHLT